MERFVYPRDYLKVKGNVKYCWEVHKRNMKEIGEPYVDYFSFYNRIKRYNWDLYRAIHTPARIKGMVWYKELLIILRTQYYRFIYLFKRWIEKK